MACAHCGFNVQLRSFCCSAHRQRAYRRRKQGLPEDALPTGGQAGHLTLSQSFDRALLAEAVAELTETRRILGFAWFARNGRTDGGSGESPAA